VGTVCLQHELCMQQMLIEGLRKLCPIKFTSMLPPAPDGPTLGTR
jgi:hypothetical protein